MTGRKMEIKRDLEQVEQNQRDRQTDRERRKDKLVRVIESCCRL